MNNEQIPYEVGQQVILLNDVFVPNTTNLRKDRIYTIYDRKKCDCNEWAYDIGGIILKENTHSLCLNCNFIFSKKSDQVQWISHSRLKPIDNLTNSFQEISFEKIKDISPVSAN